MSINSIKRLVDFFLWNFNSQGEYDIGKTTHHQQNSVDKLNHSKWTPPIQVVFLWLNIISKRRFKQLYSIEKDWSQLQLPEQKIGQPQGIIVLRLHIILTFPMHVVFWNRNIYKITAEIMHSQFTKTSHLHVWK